MAGKAYHKKTYKRKRHARKPGVTKAVKKYVRKAIAIAPEALYAELVTFSGYAISNTPYVSRFTNLPYPGGVADRKGVEIRLKSLYFDIDLTGCTTALAAGTAAHRPVIDIRIIVGLYKKPARTGVPAGTGTTGLLDNTVCTSTVSAPFTQGFRSAWTCLMDRTYTLSGVFALDSASGVTQNGDVNLTKHIRKTISLKNKKMTFGAASGGATDVEINIPFIAIMCNTAVPTYPTISMYSRMYYTDA